MIKLGQINQFELLVQKYHRLVWSTVASMMFDRSICEELVQKSFIDSYLKLDQLKKPEDFKTWVNQIARNNVKMHLRKNSTKDRILDEYRLTLLNEFDDDDTTDFILDKQEALSECLQTLPDNLRDVFDQKFHHKLTYSDISGKLKKSAEAVRKLLFRGRGLLKECIGLKLQERNEQA